MTHFFKRYPTDCCNSFFSIRATSRFTHTTLTALTLERDMQKEVAAAANALESGASTVLAAVNKPRPLGTSLHNAISQSIRDLKWATKDARRAHVATDEL